MKNHRKISCAGALLCALSSLALAADSGPGAGNEVLVNQYTPNIQARPAIGMAPDGSHIVLWEGAPAGQINSDIFARRYKADGAPEGNEFQITTSSSSQAGAAVAHDSAGNYVVAWYSQENETGLQIRFRRYSSSGSPLSEEIRVSESTNLQRDPDIAMDPAGNFVIAWSEQTGDDNNIVARRFSPNGIPNGTAFTVNSQTEFSQQFASVAMDGTGNFVIAWLTEAETQGGIAARRYDNRGVAQSTEFAVNQFTAGSQIAPAVAMDARGNFFIVWQSFGQEGEPKHFYQYGIYARAFDATGLGQGRETQVNTTTPETQTDPEVVIDRNGNVTVVWQSYNGTDFDILGQRFDRSGAALGGEFRINNSNPLFQISPAVAAGPDNVFAVAWVNEKTDRDADDIFSRCYGGTCAVAAPAPAPAPVPGATPVPMPSATQSGGGAFDIRLLAGLLVVFSCGAVGRFKLTGSSRR